MTPYYYEFTDCKGFTYSRNLHLDGAVSIHPEYLNWTQDEILERMRQHVDLLADNPQAPIGWLNERLRFIAAYRALYDFNQSRGV